MEINPAAENGKEDYLRICSSTMTNIEVILKVIRLTNATLELCNMILGSSKTLVHIEPTQRSRHTAAMGLLTGCHSIYQNWYHGLAGETGTPRCKSLEKAEAKSWEDCRHAKLVRTKRNRGIPTCFACSCFPTLKNSFSSRAYFSTHLRNSGSAIKAISAGSIIKLPDESSN